MKLVKHEFVVSAEMKYKFLVLPSVAPTVVRHRHNQFETISSFLSIQAKKCLFHVLLNLLY